MKFLKTLTDQILFRCPHVCPWWLCFTFDNAIRKLFHNPERMLASFIVKGSTVLDAGAGMGYFTIPLARMVGDSGKVIAADLQQKMLDVINLRAHNANVENRIILQLCTVDRIGIMEPVDFCLAFWMIHEVRYRSRFFSELYSSLKPNGLLLIVEPKIHVTRPAFAEILQLALSSGFKIAGKLDIRFSYSALLKKIV